MHTQTQEGLIAKGEDDDRIGGGVSGFGFGVGVWGFGSWILWVQHLGSAFNADSPLGFGFWILGQPDVYFGALKRDNRIDEQGNSWFRV
jgi:hypothetical protein